jgi:phage shock protein A
MVHSTNRCISIDTNKADLLPMVGQCIRSADKVVNLIRPGEMQRISDKISAAHGQAMDVINEAILFVEKSFEAAHNKCSSLEKKVRLLEARNNFYNSVDSLQELILAESNGGTRDQSMLRESEKAINQLPEDASATIIVGALHSRFLAKHLSDKFPDRAVVLAVYTNENAQAADAQIAKALRGTERP